MAPSSQVGRNVPVQVIDRQVQKLCRSALSKDPKLQELLQFLVRIQREGYFQPPFSTNKPKPTGEKVTLDFYARCAADEGRVAPTDREQTKEKGKRLVSKLRQALGNYNDRSKDTLAINVPQGRGPCYEPQLSFRRSDGSSATIVFKEGRYTIEREQPALDGTAPGRFAPRHGSSNSSRLGSVLSSSAEPRAFDEFFGDGVFRGESNGIIVLQVDRIQRIEEDAGLHDKLATSSSRVYKARNWINACDTYGALAIQDSFHRRGVKSPKLVLSDHYSHDASDVAATFTISMGLGFTSNTIWILANRSFEPWMRISLAHGDALSLTEALLPKLPRTFTPRLLTTKDDSPGFCRLVPLDWDEDHPEAYVERWYRMLPPWDGPEVRDYALIIRHTNIESGAFRRVSLVVAGFTERATAIGACYLADHWPQLWERFVQGHGSKGSLGDFLILIEGPSDVKRLRDWSECPEFEITPRKLLRASIKCEWADRLSRKKNRTDLAR